MDHPSSGYSLDEAAAILSVAPATLRFWEETFNEDLGVPRDERGEPRFSPEHIEVIRRIKRLVQEDGVTLDQAKHALHAGELSTAPPHDDPGNASDLRALVAGLTQTLNEMVRLLSKLQEEILRHDEELEQSREEIRYIIEENRALQELVARLVERIDALGAPLAPSDSGADAWQLHERSHPAPHGRIVVSSAQAGPAPAILLWRPEDLARAAARLHDTRLILN